MSAALDADPGPRAVAALAAAEEMVAAGRVLDAVEALHEANGVERDAAIEIRLAELRYRAFSEVPEASRHATWPVRVDAAAADPTGPDDAAGAPGLARVAPADLDADSVRRGILTRGAVHVPGLIDAATVDTLVEGIEHVLAVREANQDTPHKTLSSWFRGLPLPREEAIALARPWIAGDGGVLACDSPRLLDLVLRTYERVGLRRVVEDYLGERPVLSANKATLRRARLEGKSDWHQDGAFMGTGIRALNVWVALTDCGVDAPGMDLVPKRFETVQETGTGGAIFDWAVGPDTVATLAADAPVVRPRFAAGDVVLFDDLCLHRTAIDPAMTRPRHAVESWFFARTGYPTGQTPLVW